MGEKKVELAQRVAACKAKGQIFWVNLKASDAYSPPLLERLDGLCRKYGTTVEVRFFGDCFDAANLRYLPSVQNLTLDCLNEIRNEDEMAALPHLRRLSFQVRELNRPEFLSTLNLSHLEVLRLMGTPRPNLNLKPLAKAHRLHKLTVESHRRGIESLVELPKLEHLTLWGQPRSQSLAFVSALPALRGLSLGFGGRETLDDLQSQTLESLSVARVNGLRDLGPIRRYPRLTGLSVADQIRLSSINLTGTSMQYLSVANCRNLTEIAGLEQCSGLVRFNALFPLGLPWDELRDRRWPASLRVLSLWSPNMKWNKSARALHDARGYQESVKESPQSAPDTDFVGDGIYTAADLAS